MASASDVVVSDSVKRAACPGDKEEEPVEKKQKVEEPDLGLEDDSWADGPTSSTPAVGEAVAAAASSVVSTNAPGATASVVAADAKVLAKAGEDNNTKVSRSVGDEVRVKATGAIGTITMSNGHAFKVCGAWVPASDVESAKAVLTKLPQETTLTVCVRSISFSVEEAQFELDFEEHGEIEDMRFLENRGIAFVTYSTQEGVLNALKMDGDEYYGRKLSITKARSGKRDDQEDEIEAFVKGLSPSTEEDATKKYFSVCGEVVKVRLRKGEEGKSNSSAFVVFKTKEALAKALELDGKEFEGSKITVMVAKKQEGGKSKDKGKGKGKGKGKDKGKGKGKGKKGKGKK